MKRFLQPILLSEVQLGGLSACAELFPAQILCLVRR